MARIVIVGAGALGSHAALLLRNRTEDIVAVDFDRVEPKNVASQFHFKAGIGKNKAHALAGAMGLAFGRKVEVVPHRLTGDNAATLLGGAALVLDCLDNGASRRAVQRAVRAASVPCLHGALAAGGEYGRVSWDERFVIDDEPPGGAPTCEDGRHLAFVAVVAAWLAHAATLYLDGGRRVGFEVSPTSAIAV